MGNNKENDLDKIISFLYKSINIIGGVVDNPMKYLRKEFYEDSNFMNVMRKAWGEVVDTVIFTIDYNIKKIWKNDDTQHNLSEIGFSGQQFEFKMESFYKFVERFIHNDTNNWFLRQLLAIIKALLDSLKSVFPPLEALSEFLKMIEPMLSGLCPIH